MIGRRSAAALIAVGVAVLAAVRTVAARRVDDAPFCPLVARGRIGADWARRNGLADRSVPGEVPSFSVYDRPGFDADAVHPEIRRFYERTAEYALTYETIWHRPFRLGARLASIATGRLEQLNLPGRSGAVKRLESRIATVSRARDPRGSRVWTRTDPDTGEAVFVAVYATHERDGAGNGDASRTGTAASRTTYANVAVPLPWSNLSTVLRPETLELSGARGVTFTTRGDDAGGLFLVTPIGAIRLPMAQSFRVWPADAPGAPRAPGADPALVARHEMWLLGRRFLTIRYGIDRVDGGSGRVEEP